MIATVDLAAFRAADPIGRRSIARAIGEACETIGFVYVANHGVPDGVVDAALDAARRYFAQSAETKRELRMRPGEYRGYIPTMPFSVDRASGHEILYEAFIFGQEPEPGESVASASRDLRWPNRWPREPADFREKLGAYWRALGEVSRDLVHAFGLALGDGEDAISDAFDRPMTNVSVLHYPGRDPADAGESNARPHYDSNALTILLPDPIGGLEAEHLERGWIEVPPVPGAFVVNIGNEMECWSGGRFRSTMHRVHPPIGRDRYSIAYFASPAYETIVTPMGEAIEGARFERMHAGENFERFVAQFRP